jgi:hypothetical protein
MRNENCDTNNKAISFLTNQNPFAMNTLYALLVGICDYRHINGLDAATDDANRLKEYLLQNVSKNFQLKIKMLEDGKATKVGIVKAFEDHLIGGGAKNGDVVLFFFSGHGGQEKAAEVFWETEFDKKLENLACQDANLKTGKGFLADKELRWLISRAAQSGAHVVTLFDCCHSGDNTRAYTAADLPKGKRKLAGVSEPRTWQDFIFSDQIAEADLQSAHLDDLIHEGAHISLAACQSHESAYELFEGGLFTTALLTALEKSKGDISYVELRNRLKASARQEGYPDQTPQVYAPGGDPKDLFKTFLGGATKDKPVFGSVYYNWDRRTWELDLGAIYGVTKDWKGAQQRVVVMLPGGQQAFASIEAVFPAFATVRFDAYSDVKKGENYDAYVPSLMSRELVVRLAGEQTGIDAFLRFALPETLEKSAIRIVESGQDAAYEVHANGGEYRITLSGKNAPLTGQEAGYTQQSVEKVVRKLQAIGRWAFAKSLRNPISQLPADAIDIAFSQNDQPIPVQGDKVVIHLEKTAQGEYKTQVKIQLTNTTNQPLHCAMLYVSSLFGISANALNPQVQQLAPGGQTWALQGRPVALQQELYIRELNWPEEVFYFQIVYSSEEFTVELFQQEELDAPRASRGADRKKGWDDSTAHPVQNDWNTRLIEVHQPNPDATH